jgi:peptide/nickel transport system substrate-binding protein/oligopeptide transport system substrate-binding protein
VRRVALLCCILLTAAACTSDADEPPGGDESSPAPSATETSPEAVLPTPSLGDFENESDVLDVAVTQVSTLDPMRIQEPGSVLIARQLYEGLVSWDPEAAEVVPAAANSWKVTKGGRRFTFRLEQGMTFHDGSPVTAEDFAFAFNRIARKGSASAIAYTLDRIEGFTAVNQLADSNKLSGVKTPDDHTLVIELSEPFYDFIKVLTHPGLVPVPRDAAANETRFQLEPIGNGPFKLSQPWRPGEPVVLERFDGFLRTPSLEGIRFHPFPDAASSWLQFVAGELDVAEVPAGQIEAAREEFGETGYLPFLASYNFGFNVDAGPLKNRRLRRAASMAIDREAIAEEVYRGTLEPPRGVVPAGMPGFSDDACGDLCRYLPDQAAELVQGVARSKRKLTLDYTRGQPHARVARMVQENLEDAGFDVTRKGYGFSAYVKRLRSGDQEMFRLGWIAEFPSPDVYLDALFRSDSPDNNSGFSSAKVDALLRRARSERSETKRTELYRRAERAILAEAPIAPIGSFVTHWAAQEAVEGIAFDVVGGFDAVPISLRE